ncbi:hypothetical protein [Pseudomonas amygdali]|uniref:Uncharacterized protein n=1 Tax=Pseudomonas amygdali pv. lachrymans str. M301315 TaxID=629260 RepID=A0AAD0PVE9_PSEAV|nr:hypothetical protein [Pseudomonas amygdali]AXH59562.1 hypothetical protein PLA107_030520 [Pseudomonas amygdali pv. lachrymans str. M301315]
MNIKAPWVPIDERLPEEDVEVIWMDIDGGYHLGPHRDGYVMPAVYGNADVVRRPLSDHVCWTIINAPEVA